MKLDQALIEELTVKPGRPAALHTRSTESTTVDWLASSEKQYKKVAEDDLRSFVDELSETQRLFWANDSHARLIILQAMDAVGKDGTIRHVMSGVNPQGCKIEAFKEPSGEEVDHDFLRHATKVLPRRGMIAIFNRSYYEEVLVVRVHPELLSRGETASGNTPPAYVWRDRYEDINTFERHLHRNGTRIVQIFLHLSRPEQKARFLKRLDNPTKNWKFSTNDLAERKQWNEYQATYQEAFTATSTPWAHRGTSSQPTTSRHYAPSSARSWSTPSTKCTSHHPISTPTTKKPWPGRSTNCSPSDLTRGPSPL
jgi:PPK2 family polyphosphate:nucleotide phosphotransferase